MRGTEWYRYMARRYLSGLSPYKNASFNGRGWEEIRPDDMESIKELAAKIAERRKRRGRSNRRTFPGALYKPSEPKSGSCSYCYPEAGSIHYTIGRVRRGRAFNPKNYRNIAGDWEQEYEESRCPELYWDYDEFSDSCQFWIDDPEVHEMCVIRAFTTGHYDCQYGRTERYHQCCGTKCHGN